MNSSTNILALGLLTLLMPVFTACQTPSDSNGTVAMRDIEQSGGVVMSKRVLRSTAGLSVQGRAIDYAQHGDGPNVAMFIGGIHGEEPASARIVEMFDAFVSDDPAVISEWKVIVLANANPDGLAVGRRVNASGVDLNRNFPATNRDNRPRYGEHALSEPEARAIAQLIRQYRPTLIVSIHQPIDCVDYDGPEVARQIATRMASAVDMQVRKLGTRPGSLGAWAGEDMGIAIITYELPGSATHMSDDDLWKRYGPALLVALE